jgi:hypothetical protein
MEGEAKVKASAAFFAFFDAFFGGAAAGGKNFEKRC